jgi:hypothetical protein
MSRRLRTALLVLVGLGIAASVAIAQTVGADTSVKPKVGKPSWKFVVSFKAPQSTGFVGASRVSYTVSADKSGTHAKDCTWSVSAPVAQATGGSMVHVNLRPQGSAGKWCRGVFHGQVQESIMPVCGCPRPLGARGEIMCPMQRAIIPCPVEAKTRAEPTILPAPQTIGTFSFRVRRHLTHKH